MDHTFHPSSSSYFNRGKTSTFSHGNKKIYRMWAFPSILLLIIVIIFSIDLSIHQIENSSTYQYVWSWTINNDFYLEFDYFINSLTSIMSILITTVGILVLIYSDSYMAHDQGYLRLFNYMSFFNTSMLGLVTSSNLKHIYIFWELVGMCSYLLNINRFLVHTSYCGKCLSKSICNESYMGLWFIIRNFRFLLDNR